jgi:hypothetical protein
MKNLLDTNVWADHLNQSYPSVTSRIRSADPTDLALSTIVLAELPEAPPVFPSQSSYRRLTGPPGPPSPARRGS